MADVANIEHAPRAAEASRRPDRWGRAGRRALVVAATVAAAALTWVVGEPLLGHDLVITPPGDPARDLGLAAVVFVTLIAGLAGWAALAVLERITARAVLVWTVVALALLAVSFLPFAGVRASGGSTVVLALMHVVVAAVLVPGLRRTSPRRAAQALRAG